MNSRFLKALLGEQHDCTPVWVMRQAGRYLPEYRALRSEVKDFMSFCKTPELACEATLQPIHRFGFDAAILFSDILTIPDAMDLGLHFIDGEGPIFQRPIRSEKDVENIVDYDSNVKLNYVYKTIKLIKKELNNQTPLIGFSGSPWTLAAYMVEGKGSKQFLNIRKMLYQSPSLMHQILKINTKKIIEYLHHQILAGVDAVMIFDTWGGILTPELYQEFSLNYMRDIISSVQKINSSIPVIIYTKGGGMWLERMLSVGAHAIGLDWSIDIAAAKHVLGEKITLQGNLDPAVLYSSCDQIEQAVKKICDSYGPGYRHVFNLGHGIAPDVCPDKVGVLVEAVRKYGQK